MIDGMVQGYLNSNLGENFQLLLCCLGIYSKYFEFFIHFYQSEIFTVHGLIQPSQLKGN